MKLLTVFLWIVVIWHGIGLLGAIEQVRSRPRDGWQWVGFGGAAVILALALWLLVFG